MKLQRHTVVTALLTVYALFMTFYFGLDLLRQGQETRFFSTVAAEALLIVLTWFFLRRRDQMRNNRRP